MNRVIIILSLVVIAGYVTPDLSQAHRYILALPEDERQSLRSREPAEFVGPVLRSEGLSHARSSRHGIGSAWPIPIQLTFQAASGIILLPTEASMHRTASR
jgi:hypothetical protein